MTDKELKQFVKDRDKAVASMDIAKFKKFHRKYYEKGVYKVLPPSDKVLEIVMRKMAIHSTNISKEVKAEAKEWLASRGYSMDIY